MDCQLQRHLHPYGLLFGKLVLNMNIYEILLFDRIAACRKILEQRTVQDPPTECLVEMLTLVLKHNNFTFNGYHYLQINGRGPGGSMS